MYKKLLAIAVVVAPLIAIGADKFVYDPYSGIIMSETPAATVGKGDKILGSQVWYIKGDTPALGESDYLYTLVTEETKDFDGKVVTQTRNVRKNNTSELKAFTKLYPLDASQKQAAKDVGLRQLENRFVAYYTALGFTEKPGFDEIMAALKKMDDKTSALEIAVEGLAIDAAAKRYSATWWDDCTYHPEIVK